MLAIFRKFLVVLLAFLVFIELPILVGAFSAKETILDENFYLKEFSRREIYSLAKEQAISIASGIDSGGMMGKGEQAEFARKVADSVPNSYLGSQARAILSNFLGYLKGQKSALELEIDLSPVRPALSKTATDLLLLQMKEKYSGADFAIPPLPGVPTACTNLISCIEYCRDSSHTQECDTFLEASGLLSAPGAPPELAAVFGSGEGFSGIDSLVAEKIPEKIGLAGYLEPEMMKNINEARSAIATINNALLLGFLLVIFELALIALIEFDIWKGAGKIGIALIVSSFSIGIPALLAYFLLPGAVADAIPPQMAQMQVVSAFALIGIDLGQEMAIKAMLAAGAALVIGGIFLLCAKFLPGKLRACKETKSGPELQVKAEMKGSPKLEKGNGTVAAPGLQAEKQSPKKKTREASR